MTQQTKQLLTSIAIVLAVSFIFAASPAYAAVGGLSKVNDFMDDILKMLQGLSLAVVTIAFIWAGYKFLFQHADIMEVLKIVGGGILIGGAGGLASFFVS